MYSSYFLHYCYYYFNFTKKHPQIMKHKRTLRQEDYPLHASDIAHFFFILPFTHACKLIVISLPSSSRQSNVRSAVHQRNLSTSPSPPSLRGFLRLISLQSPSISASHQAPSPGLQCLGSIGGVIFYCCSGKTPFNYITSPASESPNAD